MLDLALRTAERAATEAGRLLLRRAATHRAGEADAKQRHELATADGRRANAIITRRLLARFSAHGVLAEEGRGRSTTSGYTWVIVPLDGPANYAARTPYYAVSIALVVNGSPILGVVSAPATGESFRAIAGRGAHCDGRRLRVSKTTRLSDASVDLDHVTNAPGPRRPGLPTRRCLTAATHVRRSGSTALDLCYLAAGRIDGVVLSGPANAWGLAAGIVIAREAGAEVSDGEGRPYTFRSRPLVATNGAIHGALLGRGRR